MGKSFPLWFLSVGFVLSSFVCFFLVLVSQPYLIIQWNVRGIRQKRTWLSLSPFCSAEIFVFQESFLKPDVDFSIPNKTIYRNDRSGRGGGLLTAVCCRFPSVKLDLDGLASPDVELLGVKFWDGDHWITVINLYAPGGRVSPSWLESLVNQLHPPFYILGDFNCKHRGWGNSENSPGADQLHSWLLNSEICLLTGSNATHLAPSGIPSVIDLSLASPDAYRASSLHVHHDLFDSDHFPILIRVAGSAGKSVNRVTRTHWAAVNRDLDNLLLTSQMNSFTDVETAFVDCRRKHSSSTVVARRSYAPWWDTECARLLALKRRLFRRARTHLSRELWMSFKRISAQLRRLIKHKTRAFWTHICESGRAGNLYKIFRCLSNRTGGTNSHIVISDNGTLVADRHAQAETFADFFCPSQGLPCIPVDLSSPHTLWDQDFSIYDLRDAIKRSRDSSPGEDGMSSSFFRNLSEDGKRSILSLFNRSLHGGQLPDSWCSAIILPIGKPGRDKTLVSSYRPIALTAVACKIMERMILKRILDWTQERKIFHPRHFGFLPGRDCTKALRLFYEDVRSARMSGRCVVAVKLDLNAAYDSVWRDGLILKLTQIGVGGDVALWISRWLRFRKVKVRWRGIFSSPRPNYRGIPQGSVLSPFLFMVFLWDLFDLFDSGVEVIVYADDIIIYCCDSLFCEAMKKIQETLNRIQQWFTYWHLSVRADKCAAIHFSRSPSFPDPNLRIYGSDIAWCRHIKILGLTFSHNLTFQAHLTNLQQKCNKRINILKVFASHNWGARTPTLICLANSLIRSVLDYAASLYSSASKSSLAKLSVIYNTALRIASGVPRWTPLFKLYRELGQVPLPIRRSFLCTSSEVKWVSSFYPSHSVSPGVPGDLRWDLSGVPISGAQLILPRWPVGRFQDCAALFLDVFPFQSKDFPSQGASASFSAILNERFAGFTLIATDASKDAQRTSIAAVMGTGGEGAAALVHHANSVFSAEALAIAFGIQTYASQGRCVVFSDSMSVLRALENVNPRSPRVILLLFAVIRAARLQVSQLALVWVPGHTGIPLNEAADMLAKNGPFRIGRYGGISPEDVISRARKLMHSNAEEWWMACPYSPQNDYLGPNIYNLSRSRSEDTFLCRMRTLSMVTESRLFKYNLRSSPTCGLCSAGDGSEYHYIYECRYFLSERGLLSLALKSSVGLMSWGCFWASLEEHPACLRLFLNLWHSTGGL